MKSSNGSSSERNVDVGEHYDFIVCGAGSSGSVVAGRLAANPDVRLLLLEAGSSDELDIVMDIDRWVTALGSDIDWAS